MGTRENDLLHRIAVLESNIKRRDEQAQAADHEQALVRQRATEAAAIVAEHDAEAATRAARLQEVEATRKGEWRAVIARQRLEYASTIPRADGARINAAIDSDLIDQMVTAKMARPGWPPGLSEDQFTYSTIAAPAPLSDEGDGPLAITEFGRSAAALLGKMNE